MKTELKASGRIIAVLVTITILLSFSACEKETVEDIMTKARENIQAVESMSYAMTMDLGIKISGMTTSLQMDTVVDYIKDPLTIKVTGSFAGTGYTLYAEQIDGVYVTYMQNSGDEAWYRQELEGIDELQQYDAQHSMELYLEVGEGFVENGKEEINGSPAVRYDGIITGDAIGAVIAESGALEQLGLDEASLEELTGSVFDDVGVSIWIDEESYIPVKYNIDMTAIMQKLISNLSGETALLENTEITGFVMTVSVSNINEIEAIEIPAQARAAA